MDNIVFFNWFHNGDIHVSRTFVREIALFCLKNNIKSSYFHQNNNELLLDIDCVPYNVNRPSLNERDSNKIVGNTLYMNTWYGCEGSRFYNAYGLTYNCLYHMFNSQVQKCLGFKLTDISSNFEYFYPDINFQKFHIQYINEWVKTYISYKKVLFSNCQPMSGQAANINLDGMIQQLADKYHGTLFITTNPTSARRENIFYSKDIINKPNGSDLNENAYLSTFCDIVVGRISGPHTFMYNKQNMFNSKKKMFSLTHLPIEAMWYNINDIKLNYTCDLIHTTTSNPSYILSMIDSAIISLF